MKRFFRTISNSVSMLTDWLLIIIGLLLLLLALLRIDVAAAKYIVAACGGLISLAGFRFRRRRLLSAEGGNTE